ncbi:MAG: hypothetical protein LBB39_02695, partial [Mycoplasmataceae bacterium]|nr:hypothetical protein [Mycoplasmataceae bacterium]
LEQYETISKRKLTGNIRYDENIKHAHKTMIDNEKQKEFCVREVKLINDFHNKPVYDKKLSQKDNLKNELEWTKMIEKQKKEQLLEINCRIFHLQQTAKQLEEKFKGLANNDQLIL